MKQKRNIRQIAALIGVAVIAAMYVVSLILALLAKPGASQMFIGSVACTIFIPILLYVLQMFYRMRHKEEEPGTKELKK